MKRIDFRKLSWPANAHMDLLAQIFTERELLKLINFFADKKYEFLFLFMTIFSKFHQIFTL